jgi:hypothetical protein
MVQSPLDNLSDVERREVARSYLDSAEVWLRRLIDHQLTTAFGTAYFDANLPDGPPVIPRRIREPAMDRTAKEPDRFARPVDATTLGEAIDLVLHDRLYEAQFRQALDHAFPDGRAEARTFLSRLLPVRNKVQHGGIISSRERFGSLRQAAVPRYQFDGMDIEVTN